MDGLLPVVLDPRSDANGSSSISGYVTGVYRPRRRPAGQRETWREFPLAASGDGVEVRAVPAAQNVHTQGLVEFGGRLRSLRGERYLSLVEAAKKAGSSKAALSRYERGEVLMPMALAERLDELYRAGGELIAERAALFDGSWLPRGAFRTRWDQNHPATYSGPIWMWVVPDPVFAGCRHRVEVRWGDWRLCHEDVMAGTGVFFAHTKGDDGLSKPLEVTVMPACKVAFGQGLPPGVPVIDINHGWSHWVAYDVLAVVRKVAPRPAERLERALRRAPVPYQRG